MKTSLTSFSPLPATVFIIAVGILYGITSAPAESAPAAAAVLKPIPGLPIEKVSADEFKEKAHACMVALAPFTKGKQKSAHLAAGCLRISTRPEPKGQPQPMILPQADGFSVSDSGTFSIDSPFPLFAFGIVGKPGVKLQVSLHVDHQRTEFAEGDLLEGAIYQEVFNVTNDELLCQFWVPQGFRSVTIKPLNDDGSKPLYTKILTGCRPRLDHTISFEDASKFCGQTLATGASGPLGIKPPQNFTDGLTSGASGPIHHFGSLGFVGAHGTTLGIGDSLLAGGLTSGNALYDATLGLMPGAELTSNSNENIDVCSDSPVTAMGFYIVELSETKGNAFRSANPAEFEKLMGKVSMADSSFELKLFHGDKQVGAPRTFQPAKDIAAFCGVLSPEPFTRVEIRETCAAPAEGFKATDNEFFGQFYTTPCGCCCGDKPARK